MLVWFENFLILFSASTRGLHKIPYGHNSLITVLYQTNVMEILRSKSIFTNWRISITCYICPITLSLKVHLVSFILICKMFLIKVLVKRKRLVTYDLPVNKTEYWNNRAKTRTIFNCIKTWLDKCHVFMGYFIWVVIFEVFKMFLM